MRRRTTFNMPASFLGSQNRYIKIIGALLVFLVLGVFWTRHVILDTIQSIPIDRFWARPNSNSTSGAAAPDVGLVVASTLKDNTTWLDHAFLEWEKFIYVVNDRNAKYTVPVNKGREANVYLTYVSQTMEKWTVD